VQGCQIFLRTTREKREKFKMSTKCTKWN
jgi:hypothetical protein